MGKVRVKGHRWGWREVRGSSGKCLRILEKEENKNSILYFFFYQNKSWFFFFFFFLLFPHFDSLAAWVCLHCPHFQLQMLGLCKKKKKKFMFLVQSADRDCYSCDVISNFPPANWLTKQECGLKDKESRNRDIKLDFFTKQGPQKYTQLLQVSCSLTQISTVFSAL